MVRQIYHQWIGIVSSKKKKKKRQTEDGFFAAQVKKTKKTLGCLVCVLFSQSCLTLYDPMDCSPTRLLCSWNSPGKNTGVGSHSLLQGIFLTQ